MILRLSDSLSRGLLVAAALLVGLWLSFFGIRAAIARARSEAEKPERLQAAVRLEPENPAYWYILGRYQQYNLEQPDAAQAEASYRRAIALDPDATEAWLDLGTAYELDGDLDQARDAYLHAKKTYPASADVAWRYGNFLLRQGQQDQAYAELKSAIAADPHRAAAAFSRTYRTNPNIDELLDRLLPPIPSVYVEVISEALSSKQLAVAKTVWARLINLRLPPPQELHLEMRDIDRFVTELLYAGEFSEARHVWDQGLATMKPPPLYQLQGSVVWDPSFESGVVGSAFGWHYSPITQSVRIGLDRSQWLSGKQSLRLSFDGKHDPNLEAACTNAVVQPSTTYRFSGWIKTDALTTDQGVAFRLRSGDDAATPAVSTPSVTGTNPWAFVDQSWTSGPKGHGVQICVVRDASEDSSVRISGTAWIDDVNLVPQPAEHRKP